MYKKILDQRNKAVSKIVNCIHLNRKKLVSGVCISVIWTILSVWVNAPLKAILLLDTLIIGLSSVSIECKTYSKQTYLFLAVLFTIGSAFVTLYLSQFVNDAGFWILSPKKIMCGVICCILVYLFILVLSLNLKLSLIVGSILILTLSTVNYYVYTFRGNELIPSDLFAIGTAMNVIQQYSLKPTRALIYGWGILILWIYLLCLFKNRKKNQSLRTVILLRCSLLIAGMISIAVFSRTTSDIYIPHFKNGGTWNNGFVLNFALTLKQSFVHKPQEYDLGTIDSIADQYVAKDEGTQGGNPNIIVLMNESFADFCVLDEDFCEKYGILSYYHALTENTVKGYALTSVYGGKTPNSEYEFLTSNSMAFLPEGSIPYQQFIQKEQYSMVSVLNNLGYTCIATHPYYSSGWNRVNVYRNFGFSKWTFLGDYPQENLLRDYVSDQEMYEYIIEQYENRDVSNPWFLFGVTMQNHGGYDYIGNFQNKITSFKYETANQYLTVIAQSDQALSYLISYFSQVEEDVVIVMFGDHYPGLNDEFFNDISGGNFDSLEDQIKLYNVPFLIWANYDIEEAYVECTSLNYLSSYVYEAAGISLPPYNRFLKEVEAIIPAMNALGYYSAENNSFVPYEKANGTERDILKAYEMLQYNSIFDSENRSDILFPATILKE